MQKNCIYILSICAYLLQFGKTRFHKRQHFDKIHDGVYYLSEKADTSVYSRYSSIYPREETPEIPPWLAYDGQV